jgi:preprotein translocase SecE subunit
MPAPHFAQGDQIGDSTFTAPTDMMNRIRIFLKDIVEELAKISWPPIAEALRASQAVIWVSLVSMAILATAGSIAAYIIKELLG